MDIRDRQMIKDIRDNTRAMAEAFGRIADALAEALELYVSTQTETQNSNLIFEKRTMRDCYNCKKYETEGECIECHYEPKDECAKEYEELGLKELKELIKADRKTENSSEKPNNSTGYNLSPVEDELQMGDSKPIPLSYRVTQIEPEPQTEVDWKQRLCDMYGADRKSFDEAWSKYEADKVEDEPQTDCAWGKGE